MSLRTLAALPLLLAACAGRPQEPGSSATDATNDGTTTSAPSMSDTGSSSAPASTDPGGGTTGGDEPTTSGMTPSFITSHDFAGLECDQWEQNCPEGQKCMPYSGDGDNSWESLKCVDVVPDPDGMYEDCMVFGSNVSGEDTCDEGLMCWKVDPDTGVGYCIGLCTGSPDAPDCADPGASCFVGGDGVLTLCHPTCDPLKQDCLSNELCIPNPIDADGWFCVLDASGDEGQVFDVCEYANACDPGLLCINPSTAGECDALQIGCCLPLCDITLPNTCPGAGQECLPWYEPGEAPPDLKHVGLCVLPMP